MQPTSNGIERPTRTVNDATRELLGSAERQREGWVKQQEKITADIKQIDAVIRHLRAAVSAADGQPKTKSSGRGKWHACLQCGRSTPRSAADELCAICAGNPSVLPEPEEVPS